MEQNLNSEEDCRMYNGLTVMTILTKLGQAATAEKICDEIVHMTDQPKEVVEPEVRSILRRGITNGFLVRFGKNYLLSGRNDVVQVDSKRKSYRNIGKISTQRKRNVKSIQSRTEPLDDDIFTIHGNIGLSLEQTDSADKNNDYVIVRTAQAVNAILDDVHKEIQTSEPTSEEQYHFVDLRGIITKNLINLSIRPTEKMN